MTVRTVREKWYETFVVVEPVGGRCIGFPVDMLRYATCVPATEADSYTMVMESPPRDRRVVLRRFSRDGATTLGPTVGEDRWRSMGWSIVAHCKTRDEAERRRT